jgi:hypothetical protein
MESVRTAYKVQKIKETQRCGIQKSLRHIVLLISLPYMNVAAHEARQCPLGTSSVPALAGVV